MPGDTIEFKDGVTYINGSICSELNEMCPQIPEGNFGTYVVPDGCYFMLGDNRNNSFDSRYWNSPYVPRKDILGKAWLRYWPGIKSL